MLRSQPRLLICFFMLSIIGNAQKSSKNVDRKLVKTYDKYVENQYDYQGRDTILNRFKIELKSALQNENLKNYFFSEWDEKRAIVVSKDSALTIISWDWENNGTFHRYESMYRFVNEDRIFTGFLFEDQTGINEAKAAIYFEINQLPDSSYLIKGWGTHGGGKEFFILRKLIFKNDMLKDCEACFEGNDYLFFEKSRGKDLEPKYNEETKTITYPEQVPHLLDGEETGFSVPTGKMIKLKFENGNFVR